VEARKMLKVVKINAWFIATVATNDSGNCLPALLLF